MKSLGKNPTRMLLSRLLFSLIFIAGSSVFAAEDTLIDATFSSQDGRSLGSIGNDPTISTMDTIYYCEEDLSLDVMIHAQTASGAGAEYAQVQLLIDSAVTVTDTLNMAGVVYVNLDHPDISQTSGDLHTVEVKLVADSDFNATEASGILQVVDCGEAEAEPEREFRPFKIERKPHFIDDEPYIFVPLQEAIDLIWLTRDKIDEMNRNGELKADVRIMLPQHVVEAIEKIVNENPALQRELKLK